MTNQLAIILGVFLVVALAVDIAFFGTEHIVFLGKKLFAAIDWMAFWR